MHTQRHPNATTSCSSTAPPNVSRVAAFTLYRLNQSELLQRIPFLCSWQCSISEDGANLDQFNQLKSELGSLMKGITGYATRDTLNLQYVYVTILALQFKDELPEIVTAPMNSPQCVHFIDTV